MPLHAELYLLWRRETDRPLHLAAMENEEALEKGSSTPLLTVKNVPTLLITPFFKLSIALT